MKVILTACAVLFSLSPLAAEPGPIESLVDRSPFLPPGYRSREVQKPTKPAEPVSAAQTRFELVGVVANDGVVSVSIRRKGQPRGSWLAPGESLDEVQFIRFDLAKREAVVEHQGRRETIPLKAPSVTGEIPVITMDQQPKMPPPPNAKPGAPPTPKPETVKIPVRRRVIVPAE